MPIYHTVCQNTIKTYSSSKNNIQSSKKKLYSDNLIWDKDIIPCLKDLCVKNIVENWDQNPVLSELIQYSDKCKLLKLLPCDLPLELTVPLIQDDIYWERCFKYQWPENNSYGRSQFIVSQDHSVLSILNAPTIETFGKKCEENDNEDITINLLKEHKKTSTKEVNNTNSSNKSWLQFYLEIYLQEILENLEPESYDPEFINKLAQLCCKYVVKVDLRQLKSAKSPSYDHILLNSIISALPHLNELYLHFGESNVGMNFEWYKFNISLNDCKSLGIILERSRIKILRINCSDINCTKITLLMKSFAINETLNVLDFSYCHIADIGLLSIANSLEKFVNLHSLILISNRISAEGVQELMTTLVEHKASCIKYLNLRLNPIGPKGGEFVINALLSNDCKLHHVVMSACGLTAVNKSLGKMLAINSTLLSIDLSCNDLGKEVGENMRNGLKKNEIIQFIDARMCNLTSEIELEIETLLYHNRKNNRQHQFIDFFICNRNNVQSSIINQSLFSNKTCEVRPKTVSEKSRKFQSITTRCITKKMSSKDIQPDILKINISDEKYDDESKLIDSDSELKAYVRKEIGSIISCTN